MPSIETQNVSSAAAYSIPQIQPVQNNTAVVATPQQIAQASEVAVDRATLTPRRHDSERTVQANKRTEGTFATQRTRDNGSGATASSDKRLSSNADGKSSLSVLA